GFDRAGAGGGRVRALHGLARNRALRAGLGGGAMEGGGALPDAGPALACRAVLRALLRPRAGARPGRPVRRLRQHLGRLVDPPEPQRIPVDGAPSAAAREPVLRRDQPHLFVPARLLLRDPAAPRDRADPIAAAEQLAA